MLGVSRDIFGGAKKAKKDKEIVKNTKNNNKSKI